MAKKRELPTEHRDAAEKLAMHPYAVVVIRDTDGNGGPVYLAINTELNGCMAHGKNSEEAIRNLKDARIDYIQVLLLSGAPVPSPSAMEEVYTKQTSTVSVRSTSEVNKDDTEKLFVTQKSQDVLVEYSFRLLPTEA